MTNSNLISIFGIIFVLVISFSIVYLVNEWYRTEYLVSSITKENWYMEHHDFNEKKIYITGPSYVWALNSTQIEKTLLEFGHKYEVYNLGVAGEFFPEQLRSIETAISSNPEIVLLSLSYSQTVSSNLDTTASKLILPHPTNFLKNFLIDKIGGFDLLNFKNPKLISFQIMDLLLGKKPREYNVDTKEPFTWKPVLEKVRSEKYLKEFQKLQPTVWYENTPDPESYSIQAFKKIVNKYKENGIKIIVFVPPFHDLFWEKIDANKKEKFYSLIKNLELDLDIKIHDLHNKYSDEKIWHDVVHVSRTPLSTIYTDEISRIIVEELKSNTSIQNNIPTKVFKPICLSKEENNSACNTHSDFIA